VFSFRIPTSYSEGWNLFDIAKFGTLLEVLFINQQNVKSKISKENGLNNNETDRKNYTNAIMPLSYTRQPFASLQ
ncbi:4535_t:CDS:2, partial [Funneliformis caledonium]